MSSSAKAPGAGNAENIGLGRRGVQPGLVVGPQDPPMPLDPGTRLGPYAVTGPLGAGGMGEICRVRNALIVWAGCLGRLRSRYGGHRRFSCQSSSDTALTRKMTVSAIR